MGGFGGQHSHLGIEYGVPGTSKTAEYAEKRGEGWLALIGCRPGDPVGAPGKWTPFQARDAVPHHSRERLWRLDDFHVHHARLALLQNAGMNSQRRQRRIQRVWVRAPDRATRAACHPEGQLGAKLVGVAEQIPWVRENSSLVITVGRRLGLVRLSG